MRTLFPACLLLAALLAVSPAFAQPTARTVASGGLTLAERPSPPVEDAAAGTAARVRFPSPDAPEAPASRAGIVQTLRTALYGDPLWEPLRADRPAAEPSTSASLLHDARALFRRLTSFEHERLRVEVDPLKPRWSLEINLSTQIALLML